MEPTVVQNVMVFSVVTNVCDAQKSVRKIGLKLNTKSKKYLKYIILCQLFQTPEMYKESNQNFIVIPPRTSLSSYFVYYEKQLFFYSMPILPVKLNYCNHSISCLLYGAGPANAAVGRSYGCCLFGCDFKVKSMSCFSINALL